MQESFWWWQCSNRYIISLFTHLHTPSPPPPPHLPMSLISLVVCVDVKHHLYLLSTTPTTKNTTIPQHASPHSHSQSPAELWSCPAPPSPSPPASSDPRDSLSAAMKEATKSWHPQGTPPPTPPHPTHQKGRHHQLERVCETDRESGREKKGDREKLKKRERVNENFHIHFAHQVCMHVLFCVQADTVILHSRINKAFCILCVRMCVWLCLYVCMGGGGGRANFHLRYWF